MMKSYTVFHIEQKTEFEKFNCFFVNFLRCNFGRIKVILTVVKRENTPDIARQICLSYQLTGLYRRRGFTERYFLKVIFLKTTFISLMLPNIVLNRLYPEHFAKIAA